MSEVASPPVVGQVIDREGDQSVRLPAVLTGGRRSKAYISAKADTDSEKGAIMRALVGKVPKLTEHINKVILVRNIIVQPIELVDDNTGEVKAANRQILLLADGTMLGSVSEGIQQSLVAAVQLWQEPPWNPPIGFTVVQTDTNSGGRWLTLDFASRAAVRTK